MRQQNQGRWETTGSPAMSLRWDTDILNHTSANGIHGFEMVCLIFLKIFINKKKIKYSHLAWNHKLLRGKQLHSNTTVKVKYTF